LEPIELVVYALNQLLNGVLLGGIYAVTAMGFTLIYGVLHVVNFSHGEFFMVGAYVSYFAFELWGLDPLTATLLAAGVGGLLGVIIYRGVLTPLMGTARGRTNALLATFGLRVLFQNLAMFFFGLDYKAKAYYFPGSISYGQVSIGIERIVYFVVSMLILAVFWYLLKYRKIGLGIRAVAENIEIASVMGVKATRIFVITFCLSLAITSAAGALLMPLFLAYPTVGAAMMFRVFAIVILGGMGSVKGSVLASFVIGIAEALSAVVFGMQWMHLVPFAILIAILTIRPSGLFGRHLKR
jgi:branched-chain amino acid transport system permease protein